MCLHRDRGDGPHRPRNVVPDCGEEALARALAAGERGEEPPLAVEPMLAVLRELRGRLEDPWPVPGAQEARTNRGSGCDARMKRLPTDLSTHHKSLPLRDISCVRVALDVPLATLFDYGVPASMAWFPFNGWNESFFGDLHMQGKEGVQFFTQQKVTTTRWFSFGEGDIWHREAKS